MQPKQLQQRSIPAAYTVLRNTLSMWMVLHHLGHSESLSIPFSFARLHGPPVRNACFTLHNRNCIQRETRHPIIPSASETFCQEHNPSQSLDSSKTDASSSSNTFSVPSYRKLLVFVGTTILIWVSEPLLSLVDTTVIGRSPGKHAVMELAALGPATMLIDSLVYLTYFLAIATTNLMAKSLAKRNVRALRRDASHVLGVASIFGFMITAVVFGFGKPILESWTTGTSQQALLVQAAFQYAKIRSLVAPLAIMGVCAQAICLACLDTKTPAVAVTLSSFLNIVGDVWLVSYRKMGIRGAAIATAVASSSSSAVLLAQIKRKMNQWKKEQLLETPVQGMENANDVDMRGKRENDALEEALPEGTELGVNRTEDSLVTPSKESTSGVNGDTHQVGSIQSGSNVLMLGQQDDETSFISLPDRKSLLKLVKLSGPIFFVIVGKIICYSAMTLRATGFGMLALASHNVMMRVFFFFTTFGDSVGQAAQSFIPQVVYHKNSNQSDKKDTTKLLLRLGIISAYIGVATSYVGGWILRHCGSYFTNNPSILSLMAKHTTFFMLALLVHPFIMLYEGAMVATSDLTYLVGNYVITMCLLMAQLKFGCSDFGNVWLALFVFQMLRLVQFSTRFFNKIVQKEVVDAKEA